MNGKINYFSREIESIKKKNQVEILKLKKYLKLKKKITSLNEFCSRIEMVEQRVNMPEDRSI